jgi:hypothetical protein
MVAFNFEDKNWWQAKPPLPKQTVPIGDIRFRQLFSRKDWNALPAPVRRRFVHRLDLGDTLIYRGHVEFNRVNRWGKLLTNLLRIAGAPLPLDTNNEGAAAIVTVTEAPAEAGQHGGQIWMRQYARKDAKHAFPQVIQTAKRFQGPTGIEEYIGGGIGMTLMADVEGQTLIFRAQDIFWDIKLLRRKKIRLTLPRWLGPTRLQAGHENLRDGTFAFTLTVEHKWFGKMIDQRVWFQDDLTQTKSKTA